MDQPRIIFEDKNLLVVDKPSGWTVDVLRDWLKANYDYPISKQYSLRSGIVHRLDKETSGVILVAKTASVFEQLQKEFADREVKKTYIALAHGKVEPEKGLIDAPVGRLPWKRTKFGVLDEGRPAQTGYEVVKTYPDFTLLKLFPKTGRTHQIRVHLKHIGHSIVSDPLYAGRKTNRQDRKWCPRLFLHASEISFKHPVTKKEQLVRSELPSDLQISLENIS